ncbi:MAG: histidine phosphatase family protein [Pseudomonadota bacterium]
MKRLVLLRHAKSDWDDRTLPDHDRPLALRGRLAAPLMGAWLVEMDLAPDHIALSSSVRTRETWARLRPLLPTPPEPAIEPSLYEATPETVLDVIRALPETARTALLIGHNPGLETLASLLSARSIAMPTAAACVFELSDRWVDASPEAVRLAAFEAPKTLV